MTKSTSAVSYTLLGLSAGAYAALAYATPRESFTQLLLLYAFLFFCYVYVVNSRLPIWHGVAAAVVLRMIFLFAIPVLSDDYLRFIWDGNLLAGGHNPYLHLPSYYLTPDAPAIPGITLELYQQLNSPTYFSVYPPLAQGVFWLAAKAAGGNVLGSVMVMRLVLLLAETGSILLLVRLLRKMGLPDKDALLYGLNPLVILELTGNLHFEALLIFFMLLTLYLLFYQRVVWAGLSFGAAVAAKLVPLLFLPFLLRKLPFKSFLLFCLGMAALLLAVSYPLINARLLQNMYSSIGLYFHTFEFNASAYYLLRWVGFRLAGYNLIAYIGPALSVAVVIAVLALAAVKKLGTIRRLAGYCAAALTVYLLLATTVHPWYLTTLVALTTLSQFRFAMLWSGLAILTYATYRTPAYQEDLLLVTLEYTLVALWLLVELYLYRQRKRHPNLK